jgi:hypothetical protein
MPAHSCETGAACRSTGRHARGIVLSISVVLLVPSCGSGGGPSELPPDVETPVVQRVASVDVIPGSITIRTGDTVLLTATPRTASGTPVDEPVVWGSADADLTITSVAGVPNQVQVTSAVARPTHVRATVETPDGPVSGGSNVSFHTVSVATVHVLPTTTTLPVGRTMRFTATARNAQGGHERLAVIEWSTSDPNVTATSYAFNPHQADVRSLIPADAVVTASVGEVSGSGAIHFFAEATCAPADHVQIAISHGVIEVGQTTELQAIPKDVSGNNLPAAGCAIAWTWTSGLALAVNPADETRATGTGFSPATVTVTATVGAASGSVTIDVRPAGGL